MQNTKHTSDVRLLALGACVGLLAAAFGILSRSQTDLALPVGSLARVNGVLISRDFYASNIERNFSLNAASRDNINAEFLKRLIDDELLVQRGIELGMTESDLVVRQAVIDSMVASITAEADAASPNDDELEQYLSENSDRFSFTSQVWLDVWQSDKEPVAQAFIRELQNDASAEAVGDISPMADLPAGLLPMEVAANYVGAGIAAAAANMPTGSSAVFARRGRWLVVRLRDKEISTVTDLDSVRNRVLIDYRRNQAEQLLGNYIDDLRQRADITLSDT